MLIFKINTIVAILIILSQIGGKYGVSKPETVSKDIGIRDGKM